MIITTWLTIFRSPRNRYVVNVMHVSRFGVWVCVCVCVSVCMQWNTRIQTNTYNLHFVHCHFIWVFIWPDELAWFFHSFRCFFFCSLSDSGCARCFCHFFSYDAAASALTSDAEDTLNTVLLLSFFFYFHRLPSRVESMIFVFYSLLFSLTLANGFCNGNTSCTIGCKMIKYKYRYLNLYTVCMCNLIWCAQVSESA